MASVQVTTLPSGKTSFLVRYRDPDGGQNRGRRFPTKAAADKFARSVQVDIDRDEYKDPNRGKITVGKMVDEYIGVAGVAATTKAGYVLWSDRYVKPSALGKRKIANVTKADVEAFYAALRADDVGASTIQHVHQLLHRSFVMAVDGDRISKNPAHGVKLAKTQDRVGFFLSIEQVERLAYEIGPRHAVMVKFIAYCGLRAGEASSLKVRDVDLLRRTVKVTDGGTGHGTKSRKPRTVPIPGSLVDDLAVHLTAWSDPANPDAYAFPNDYGGRLNMNNFRRRVLQPAAKRVGILRDNEPPTVHDLRHSAATLWSGTYTAYEISDMLGHASVDITLRTYVHLRRDKAVQAAKADAFDAMLREASTAPIDATVTPLEMAPGRS